MKRRPLVDNVRASRDGHEYHEAWTARKAMQLLWPDSDLVAIAVEGLSPTDRAHASAQTIQIADITLYYDGHRPTFENAKRTRIVQIKYSVSNEAKEFRASEAKKTIRKFAETYREHRESYGIQAVHDKLEFQLITNQPICEPFRRAINDIAGGWPHTGEIEKQATQFKCAAGLDGALLASFAEKFKLIGHQESLPATKDELASLLVDWSATSDSVAKARLGQLRDLVRTKAGHAGTNQNLITRTDILAALQIGDQKDLLPCEPALPDVGQVLEREQLVDAMALISTLSTPLLVHAAGGVGKTVFMDSLADKIRERHEVVFFDCFGGGAYRSPEDVRHLPKKGLIHIANTLACRGLCDPILPDCPSVDVLFGTFRRRLNQCVETLSRMAPGRKLVVFIDAIDNAVKAANDCSDDSFPVKLLESLDAAPVPGVKLIVSCRTERKPSTHAQCHEFALRPFSKNETATFLRARMNKVSPVAINVAQARSGGNPRVLDYLLSSGSSLLDASKIDQRIELDELIQARIANALATALKRGCEKNDLEAFLAGLAVLPPPVPLDEYAGALAIELSAIESFASDLTPLLERTNHGLMFRDEPTETLVDKQYASSTDALRLVARNLLARQAVSVYAARALPGLLLKLNDGELLFDLAFDDRIPKSITSTVGKRNIRYARLKAATLHAAMNQDYNRLVSLLPELSTIVASDERGVAYILDHPDLVVAATDVDSMRRLFETRTGWPGTRHARLVIANTLSGEYEEATRHAVATNEWIDHERRTAGDHRRLTSRLECPDIAAIPFFLISQGRAQGAARSLGRWRDWYAYEVCEYVFDYARLAQSIRSQPLNGLERFVDKLTGIGPLAAAISFQELPPSKCKELIRKLATFCKKTTKTHSSESYQDDWHRLPHDGLRKAAAIALSLGLNTEARAILLLMSHQRLDRWSLHDASFVDGRVVSFVLRTALVSAAKKRVLHEKDVLPREIVPICFRISRELAGAAFRDTVKQRLPKFVRKERNEERPAKHTHTISDDEKQYAERFIDHRLEPLLSLTKALSSVLAASSRRVDKAFMELLKAWEDARNKRDPYRTDEINHFFCALGLKVALFILWARSELKSTSVKRFLNTVAGQDVGPDTLIRLVSILANREPLQALAGEQAAKACKLIEAEDEVTSRASYFGSLARALLPASIEDASVYFRKGLEQMDAIGSGDYDFINELLLFASEMKGAELDERDFHTLSNISELNMSGEPSKYFWGAYGRGLSKAAGPRGLAKLSRWDDRSKISLNNTLLPYLTALVADGKIEPKDALALNRLANPVEYFDSGTKEFARAIRVKAGPDPAVITELIQQFLDHNADAATLSAVEDLTSLAEETLDSSSDMVRYLSDARKRYAKARDARDEHSNYSSSVLDGRMRQRAAENARKNRARLDDIAAATDPTDKSSLVQAIEDFNSLENTYDLKDKYLAALREKVPFADRAQYIRDICALENFFFYWKLAELQECKQSWAGSSVVLDELYRNQALPLIQLHADDLIRDDRLSGSLVKEISDLTSVPVAELVLELIKIFARPGSPVAGTIWLAFASNVCPQADDGQVQLALRRLLGSDAGKLADNVVDGTWAAGLYPKNDVPAIAAGLVWRVLGSPNAEKRWRAAHSIRCFARFGRWEIVDKLVGHFKDKTAWAFQATEFKFYYFHARLWLLIALARIALDRPHEVARYKDTLLSIATDDKAPHVLIRYFAVRALLACIDAGTLNLPARTTQCLRSADLSPYPRLREKIRTHGDFYQGRRESLSKPEFQFDLDYDFHKYDVDDLSRIFGKPCWEVADMMSAIVQQLDPDVSSMYELDGRESPYSRTILKIGSRYHTYGLQLGWHALFLVASKLLATFPVTDDYSSWHKDDPWGAWLRHYGLTRNDGLWLSDGTDRTPLDTGEVLLEKRKEAPVLTGDSNTLLRLVGLSSRVGKELIVEGTWFSADNVKVDISSALVPPDKAASLVRKLISEEPMVVWIPVFDEVEDGFERLMGRQEQDSTPWIVCPSGDTLLDKHDAYGVYYANFRSHIARDFAPLCGLTSSDPFRRIWHDQRGKEAMYAQAWGREDRDSEERTHSGRRLSCTSSVLKKILAKYNKDLLLLVKLELCEREYRDRTKWKHTVAVIRISKALKVEYFKGRINHPYRSQF